MNRNTLWGTFALILLFVLAGLVLQQEAKSFSSLTNLATKPQPQLIAMQTEVSTSELVEANNRFSFKLFSQLQPQSPSQNLFISPQSVAIALGMTRNGTDGETLAEINQTLGLAKLDPAQVDNRYDKLIPALTTTDPSLKLAIANSLWVNQNIKLKAPFIDRSKNFYRAKVTNLDFTDPDAQITINQWVASNTEHKIPQIVDSLSPEAAIYLINAIYFQGSWTKKFDSSQTTEQPFFRRSQTSTSVATMSQTGDYRYYENEQFQAARLPYGEAGEMGMYVFLPQPESSLEQFNQQLNLDRWQEWLTQMRSQPGNISLPKFKLEYDTELKSVLAALGIQQAFNPAQADFSAMTDSPVAIDTVKHKAVIEVNEEGTEAAGVTSIGIRITSAMPEQQPFNLNINRPFFFVIQDDITNSILFMGNVVEP